MVINLTPELEAALTEQARQRGIAAEVLVIDVLRNQFLPRRFPFEPLDDWERSLLEMAVDCGVSLPDSALSRKELYD